MGRAIVRLGQATALAAQQSWRPWAPVAALCRWLKANHNWKPGSSRAQASGWAVTGPASDGADKAALSSYTSLEE